MRVRVKYFASLREALGEQEVLDLPSEALTVGQLRDALIGRGGAHAQALDRQRAVRCALAQRMCGEDELLQEGAELAFFPPVTGG